MVVVAVDISDVSVREVTFSHVLLLLDLLAPFRNRNASGGDRDGTGAAGGTTDPSGHAVAVGQHA